MAMSKITKIINTVLKFMLGKGRKLSGNRTFVLLKEFDNLPAGTMYKYNSWACLCWLGGGFHPIVEDKEINSYFFNASYYGTFIHRQQLSIFYILINKKIFKEIQWL